MEERGRMPFSRKNADSSQRAVKVAIPGAGGKYRERGNGKKAMGRPVYFKVMKVFLKQGHYGQTQ